MCTRMPVFAILLMLPSASGEEPIREELLKYARVLLHWRETIDLDDERRAEIDSRNAELWELIGKIGGAVPQDVQEMIFKFVRIEHSYPLLDRAEEMLWECYKLLTTSELDADGLIFLSELDHAYANNQLDSYTTRPAVVEEFLSVIHEMKEFIEGDLRWAIEGTHGAATRGMLFADINYFGGPLGPNGEATPRGPAPDRQLPRTPRDQHALRRQDIARMTSDMIGRLHARHAAAPCAGCGRAGPTACVDTLLQTLRTQGWTEDGEDPQIIWDLDELIY